MGPPSRYVKSGSPIRLSCRVYFGPGGPDDDYRRNAVMHWFHGQGRRQAENPDFTTCILINMHSSLRSRKPKSALVHM